VVVPNVVSATDKPESAPADLDGPEVPAPTATEETPHHPTEPPLAPVAAQFAHTRTTSVVDLTVVSATDKLESAPARTDGPEVPAPDVTDKSELPRTTVVVPPLVDTVLPSLPPETALVSLPETTDALTAHTNTPNAVELNVVTATVPPESAPARTDGPEVPALPETEDPETSLTEARSSNAQCAHTREPSAVVVTVETATVPLESADARTDGPEVPAPTREESLVPDTLALWPTLVINPLLMEPLPTWDLSGLPSSESSPPSASSWSLS
jgi:hypothetical protein